MFLSLQMVVNSALFSSIFLSFTFPPAKSMVQTWIKKINLTFELERYQPNEFKRYDI